MKAVAVRIRLHDGDHANPGRSQGADCSEVRSHRLDVYFCPTTEGCRHRSPNQRKPVNASSRIFRTNGKIVPVAVNAFPKQPQSMLRPRNVALARATLKMNNKQVIKSSAPRSNLFKIRSTPARISNQGR